MLAILLALTTRQLASMAGLGPEPIPLTSFLANPFNRDDVAAQRFLLRVFHSESGRTEKPMGSVDIVAGFDIACRITHWVAAR